MDDHQLRQALGNAPPAKRGWLCPQDEMLAGFAEGRLPAKARERMERHVAGCAFCRQQVAALVKLAEAPLPEVPAALVARAAMMAGEDSRNRGMRVRNRALAAAAAVCVTLVVAPMVRPVHAPSMAPAATEGEAVRKSPAPGGGPEIEFPREGAALSAQDLEFRWSGMQGELNYQVQVVTSEGDVKWLGSTESTSVRVPANVLAPGKYYVSVAANLADGKAARSAQVAFQISSGK